MVKAANTYSLGPKIREQVGKTKVNYKQKFMPQHEEFEDL